MGGRSSSADVICIRSCRCPRTDRFPPQSVRRQLCVMMCIQVSECRVVCNSPSTNRHHSLRVLQRGSRPRAALHAGYGVTGIPAFARFALVSLSSQIRSRTTVPRPRAFPSVWPECDFAAQRSHFDQCLVVPLRQVPRYDETWIIDHTSVRQNASNSVHAL